MIPDPRTLPKAPKPSAPTDVYYYRAFDMVIQSEFPLPELVPTIPRMPDLTVRRRKVDRLVPTLPTLRVTEFSADEHYLGFATIGKYLVRNGNTVDVELEPDFDPDHMSFALLGPVMAVVVHLRGNLVLHGSAMTVGTSSAIFLGDKGAGKSTIAGSMIAAGHQLLTDDVVAVDVDAEKGPLIHPGYPMIKLTDAALDTFQLSEVSLIPTVMEGYDKRRARIDGEFSTKPTPVSRAFVLARGEAAAIEPLSPLEGFQALLRYSYMVRFGEEAVHGEIAAQHMRQCAKLASAIQIARLVTPDSLERLSDAVALIEQGSS
jgi:hypothetical protein